MKTGESIRAGFPCLEGGHVWVAEYRRKILVSGKVLREVWGISSGLVYRGNGGKPGIMSIWTWCVLRSSGVEYGGDTEERDQLAVEREISPRPVESVFGW